MKLLQQIKNMFFQDRAYSTISLKTNSKISWKTSPHLLKELTMHITLYDNFKLISDAVASGQPKEKIMALMKNKFCQEAIDYTFNPKIEWLLSDKKPSFTPNRDSEDLMLMRLKQEWRRLGLFLSSGQYVNMKQSRKDELFLELLHIVHPLDAQLLIAMANKKLPFNNLTKELFEGLIPELKEKWNG